MRRDTEAENLRQTRLYRFGLLIALGYLWMLSGVGAAQAGTWQECALILVNFSTLAFLARLAWIGINFLARWD